MTVHIFSGGVGDYIGAPFKRAAINRSSKCVIDDERDAMAMCYVGKLLYVEHIHSGICDCFAKQGFGVRLESGRNSSLIGIGIDESNVNTQLLHCHAEEVERAAIYLRSTHKVVAGFAYIEDGIEIGCLSRRSEHCGNTTFKLSYFRCNGIVCRVLKSCIEIS